MNRESFAGSNVAAVLNTEGNPSTEQLDADAAYYEPLQQDTSLIDQLIKDQYLKKKSNLISLNSELDSLMFNNTINKLFYIFKTQSYKINLNNTLSVKYNLELKEGHIFGKNLNGFIKANNGKSINTQFHKLNPFEILYNLERLTPIAVYNANNSSPISIENFYNVISQTHLEDYKLYSHLKRLGYLVTFDWWKKEYAMERNTINSTFFSINNLHALNLINTAQKYYVLFKLFIIKRLQQHIISSTDQLRAHLLSKTSQKQNVYPKNLRELNDHHHKYKEGYGLINIYKSTISKQQTVKHPHLPDFQCFQSSVIPYVSDIPFNNLDYKFQCYSEITEFDKHTFVSYYDEKAGKVKETNRKDFLAKKSKSKSKNISHVNNDHVVRNKSGTNEKTAKIKKKKKSFEVGRSIVCSLSGAEDVFLEFIEVDIV